MAAAACSPRAPLGALLLLLLCRPLGAVRLNTQASEAGGHRPALSQWVTELDEDKDIIDAVLEARKKKVEKRMPERRRLQERLKHHAHAGNTSSRLVVYFVGDSLMRYQYQAFCEVVTDELPEIGLAQKGEYNCSSKIAYAAYTWSPEFDPAAVQQLLNSGHPAPKLVYVVAGFHFLHLHPLTAKMTEGKLSHLLYFRSNLRKALTYYRRAVPNVSLAVMTPYAVCENKYVQQAAQAARAAHDNSALASRSCAEAMAGRGFKRDRAEKVCAQSFFTRGGSLFVRNLVKESLKEPLEGEAAGAVSVVDAWSMSDGTCDGDSPDGRHFYNLVGTELSELLKAAHC